MTSLRRPDLRLRIPEALERRNMLASDVALSGLSVEHEEVAALADWIPDDYSDLPDASASSIGLCAGGTAQIDAFLERLGDRDALRLDLCARSAVSLQLRGLWGGIDTYLRLYDSSGVQIAWDDDSGPGLDSLLARELDAGTYYLQAGAYRDNSIGAYQVQVEVRLIGADGPPILPGTGIPAGDGDLDGDIDLDDFGDLKENFGKAGALSADFSLDGAVDLSDFGLLKQNFGYALPRIVSTLSVGCEVWLATEGSVIVRLTYEGNPIGSFETNRLTVDLERVGNEVWQATDGSIIQRFDLEGRLLGTIETGRKMVDLVLVGDEVWQATDGSIIQRFDQKGGFLGELETGRKMVGLAATDDEAWQATDGSVIQRFSRTGQSIPPIEVGSPIADVERVGDEMWAATNGTVVQRYSLEGQWLGAIDLVHSTSELVPVCAHLWQIFPGGGGQRMRRAAAWPVP